MPLAVTIDKGKKTYVPPPKKAAPLKPKGIVIRAPTMSMASIEEEENEPILGSEPTFSAMGILIEGLSEQEQLPLAVKAFFNTIREEKATRVASFVYDRNPGLYSLSFCFLVSVFCIVYLNIIILMLIFS